MIKEEAKRKNVPEVRFEGFEGEWEEVKGKDLIKVHPFNSYISHINEGGKYKVIQQGDTPVIGYSNGKPFENYENIVLFGDHTLSLYKPTAPFFIASDGVKILDTSNSLNGNFFYYLLLKNNPKSQGYKRHFTILKEVDFKFSNSLPEQSQIGTLFQQLDNQISHHRTKLQKLQQIKQAMLTKMFPQDGAKVPEVRFEGFEGEWERKKLGEMMEVKSVKRIHCLVLK